MIVRGRRVRVLRGVGTLATLGLVVAWVVSGWRLCVLTLRLNSESVIVTVTAGEVRLSYQYVIKRGQRWTCHLLPRTAFELPSPAWEWDWRPRILITPISPVEWLAIPMWMIMMPVVGTTAGLWIRGRRAPNACRRCAYDLSGIAGERACPECGLLRG